ncbi:hypothetical protein T265_05255 [Opisthorchis viverrini]|uniref:Uncharacterized protein n=1 Tax=Opisthorchis viverrini TaxID=6198 RepID=A0A074ZL33_OPIVI|nr:hypothetical protein T265_05255 [Opisthorchis viverrini]KER27766.1 hypothetical protein T265_05255 [Opisthorchis viverrini]
MNAALQNTETHRKVASRLNDDYDGGYGDNDHRSHKCAYLNLAKLFEMKEQQSTQNMLTIEPGYCNYLKQAADEKRSASHISVHQIEYVHSTLSTFRM